MAFSETTSILKVLREDFSDEIIEIASTLNVGECNKLNKYILGYSKSKDILEKSRSNFYALNEKIEKSLADRNPDDIMETNLINSSKKLITNQNRMSGDSLNGKDSKMMAMNENLENLKNNGRNYKSNDNGNQPSNEEEAIDLLNISTSSNEEDEENNHSATKEGQDDELLNLEDDLLELDDLREAVVSGEDQEEEEEEEEQFVNQNRLRVFMGAQNDDEDDDLEDEDADDMELVTEDQLREQGILDEEDEDYLDPLEGLTFDELKKRLPPYYFMNNKKKKKYFRRLSMGYLNSLQNRKIKKKQEKRVNFQLDKNQVRSFAKNERLN